MNLNSKRTKIQYAALFAVAIVATTTASVIAAEKTEYERSFFGHSWLDLNENGENSRDELLRIRDVYQDGIENQVWFLPYSGKIVVDDSSLIDIDHIVPLKEAFISGASEWETKDQREAFANDPINLEITHRSVNRSKGSKRPDQWMPPSEDYHCTYLYRWKLVKETYGLSMLPSEKRFIEDTVVKKDCSFPIF